MPAVGLGLEPVLSRMGTDRVALGHTAATIEGNELELSVEDHGGLPVARMAVRAEVGIPDGGNAVSLDWIFGGFVQGAMGMLPDAFGGAGHQV